MVILSPLSIDDFKNILSLYNIGLYKSNKHLSHALGNTVYFLTTNKGKFILKIFEDSDNDSILEQLKIMDYLSQKKVPVGSNIISKNGKELLLYKNKKIVIQKYIEGHIPKKYNDLLIKDIAKKMSLMNKYLISFKSKGKILDLQFKSNENLIKSINDFQAEEAQIKLLKGINSLNRNSLKKGIIHGDFRSVNLLIKDNKLKAIIDWGDSHKDYIAQDIAVFIIQFIVNGRIDERKIKLFLKEYQKNLKLTEEEIKAVYYFTLDRLLGVIFWDSKRMKIHADHRMKLEKEQKIMIKNYQALEKYGLDNFMKLV